MPAETSALDGYTADTRGACPFDIPHAVAYRQRVRGIDAGHAHGRHEHRRVRLRRFDIVGARRRIDQPLDADGLHGALQ